ncbi:MAG: toll/interleukin-1 receptor domain-containing protein [Anaerolineales bacterium]|nr:toll/interleukin-1 receptor domain-containing protein [Anaerolineales bacterium]
MLPQIFISYQRDQIDFVQPLEIKLKEAGFDVWIDRNIHVGIDWRKKIDEEIRKSIALIVIMTPEAKASEYVTYEWAFAYGAGVRVIPLIDIKPDELHPRLKTLQYVDYKDPQLWDKLITGLQDAQSPFLTLTIHHAVWGAKDKMNNVTHKVRANISAGRLEMQAHKRVLGDTPPGERKKLVVIYSYGGKVDTEELEENETLILPK